MSSYHFAAKVGKKGKATDHASYIAREGKYMGREVYEDLVFKESGNMPKWAEHDQGIFWKAADEFERDNGTTYREYEFALPNELTKEEQIQLVRDFVKQEIGEKHAYQYAIHSKKSSIEGIEQAHCHLMFSERTRDGIERDPDHYFKRANGKNPEKGGCKKSNNAATPTERKQELIALRGRFAELQNKHLKKHGHDSMVDHRSYKERGLDIRPEPHFGPVLVKAMAAEDTKEILKRRRIERDRQSALSQTTTKGAQHDRRNLINTLQSASGYLRTASANINAAKTDHRALDAAARYIAYRTNSRIIVAAVERCVRDQKANEKLMTLGTAKIDAKLASFEARLKVQIAEKVELQKQNELKISAEKEEKRKEYASNAFEKIKPGMDWRKEADKTAFQHMLDKQAEAERRAEVQKQSDKERSNDNDDYTM